MMNKRMNGRDRKAEMEGGEGILLKEYGGWNMGGQGGWLGAVVESLEVLERKAEVEGCSID